MCGKRDFRDQWLNVFLSVTAISFLDRGEGLQDGEVIAVGERSHMFGWQYRFRVNEGCEEWERLLMMTYVLFNYVHHQ